VTEFENADILIAMSPLQAAGVDDVGDSYVHAGFLAAYNAVAYTVLAIIEAQVASYPSYKIVVVGHSIGGAIASIAALSIKAAFPKSTLKLYTFGGLTSSMPEKFRS
jgi:predicted lipase